MFDPLLRTLLRSLLRFMGKSRAPYKVIPSDTVPLSTIPYGIYVGTGGNVTLRAVDGTEDVTYKNLPDASYINVEAKFIRATGTTATDMIAEA